MKKAFITLSLIFSLTINLVLSLLPLTLVAYADDKETLDLYSETAVLIDAANGQVLYDKNSRQRMYPASITKIITGIIAIESGKPDNIVTVSKAARYVEGTRVYLGEGEEVALEKLAYGLLMHSGNDAAISIAEYLDGSVEAFAERMNTFVATEVGVTESHFTNPHGLFNSNHYTTAYDMAQIARYAMQNDTFRKIVGTKILPWEGREWQSKLVNHNKLLWRYEGASGIKNGYVSQSGHTLVASAKRGDTEFIAVGMKSGSSEKTYQDLTRLLDYGFKHFETKRLLTGGQQMNVYQDGENIHYVVPEDIWVTIPIGAALPRYEVISQGWVLLEVDRLKIKVGHLEEKPNVDEDIEMASEVNQNESTNIENAVTNNTVKEQDIILLISSLSMLLFGIILYLTWSRSINRDRNS
jgi:D-alanyl-D-alanine carboxypeptidase (penicillin-binding protein 5/6)